MLYKRNSGKHEVSLTLAWWVQMLEGVVPCAVTKYCTSSAKGYKYTAVVCTDTRWESAYVVASRGACVFVETTMFDCCAAVLLCHCVKGVETPPPKAALPARCPRSSNNCCSPGGPSLGCRKAYQIHTCKMYHVTCTLYLVRTLIRLRFIFIPTVDVS